MNDTLFQSFSMHLYILLYMVKFVRYENQIALAFACIFNFLV